MEAVSGGSFEGLPPVLQTALTVGFFLAAAITWVVGYWKKNWGEKLKDQDSQDAAVISAAFADSKTIAELNQSIRELHKAVEALHEVNRHSSESTAHLARAVNYATEALRQTTLELIRGQGGSNK